MGVKTGKGVTTMGREDEGEALSGGCIEEAAEDDRGREEEEVENKDEKGDERVDRKGHR